MAQDGNDGIALLYEQAYQRLYRVAYRLTGSIETAEELVQDTFLLAWFRQDTLLSHPNPEAWLMCTLRNLICNEQRRASSGEISLDAVFNIPAPEMPRGIGELLPAKLPEADRELLIWRFEQELDYREIADRLGVSETGCRSRVFRALEKCRKLLGDGDFFTLSKK